MTIRFKLGELLTVDELAKQLKVSLKTVRSWIYFRKIPFTKIGRRIYFSAGVVEEMLRRNAVPALAGQHRSGVCPSGSPIPTQADKGGVNDSKENLKNG